MKLYAMSNKANKIIGTSLTPWDDIILLSTNRNLTKHTFDRHCYATKKNSFICARTSIYIYIHVWYDMIWFVRILNYVCCVSSIMYFTIIRKFARVIYANDDGSAIDGRAVCTHATLPQKSIASIGRWRARWSSALF